MRILLTLIATICLVFNSVGQVRFSVGAREGVTTSQVSGDKHNGFHKFGTTGGLTGRVVFNKVFGVEVDVLFTEKGSKYYAPKTADTSGVNNPYYTSPTYGYFLQLNYIEIPVLFQYNYPDVKGLTFEAGAGYGFLIHSAEYKTVPGYNMYQYGPPFNYYEISYTTGVSYTMSSGFGFAFRFSRSISPIRNYLHGEKSSALSPGQQNTVFSLALTYRFTF